MERFGDFLEYIFDKLLWGKNYSTKGRMFGVFLMLPVIMLLAILGRLGFTNNYWLDFLIGFFGPIVFAAIIVLLIRM